MSRHAPARRMTSGPYLSGRRARKADANAEMFHLPASFSHSRFLLVQLVDRTHTANSTMSTPLCLRPLPPTASKPHHLPPLESAIKPWKFSYAESKDGKQANLLIMLHGLGDTCAPFFALGKQLSLPATCVLSLQAPFPYVFRIVVPASLADIIGQGPINGWPVIYMAPAITGRFSHGSTTINIPRIDHESYHSTAARVLAVSCGDDWMAVGEDSLARLGTGRERRS